jgi:hypothetical protein
MRRIPGSRTTPPAPVAAPAVPADPGAATTGSSAQTTPSAQAHSDWHEGVAEDARTLPRSEDPRERWKERGRSEPLGGERYCVRFTVDAALHAQLQELQALMRHQIPDGDLGKILARAVPLLLEQLRKRKFGECSSPKPTEPTRGSASRSIPAATRRAVLQRDGEGCSYVSPDGRRCGSRKFQEFHHRDPWARTKAHPAGGITLFCHAHNQLQARRDFGEKHMSRFRSQPGALGLVQARSGAQDAPPQLDSNPVPPDRPEPPARAGAGGGSGHLDRP